MIVSVPDPIDPEQLAQRIRGADERENGYQVLVRPAQHEKPPDREPGGTFRDLGFRRRSARHRPPL